MNPDDHKPLVWTLRGSDFAMLACGKRLMHGKVLEDSKADEDGGGSTKLDSLYWPAAIQIRPITRILYQIESGNGDNEDGGKIEWDVEKPPMSKRNDWKWPFFYRTAATALAEAYRTVGQPTREGWDKITKITLSPEKLATYKKGSIHRNVQAWMLWDFWNQKQLTISQRAGELRKLGFDCTTRALERAANERGL